MKGRRREKLSVRVDPHLYQVVERYAECRKVTKTEVIEEALRLWEHTQLETLAAESYQQMAGENPGDAEAYPSVIDDISGA